MDRGAGTMTRAGLPRDLKRDGARRWSSRDDEAALRTASLSSPGFEESWRAGSPLDWTEFIARWQSPVPDDGAADDAAAGGAGR
jgi:hypothetical protein